MIALLALLCDCVKLPYNISKLVFGKERDTSVIFGLDQMLCCCPFVAPFFPTHGRVWQVCRRQKNNRVDMVVVGRYSPVHGSERVGGRRYSSFGVVESDGSSRKRGAFWSRGLSNVKKKAFQHPPKVQLGSHAVQR